MVANLINETKVVCNSLTLNLFCTYSKVTNKQAGTSYSNELTKKNKQVKKDALSNFPKRDDGKGCSTVFCY